MPPNSTKLEHEGAAFKSFLLVNNGVFQEEEFLNELKSVGGRNLSDNLSDIKAQVAANQKGTIQFSNRQIKK